MAFLNKISDYNIILVIFQDNGLKGMVVIMDNLVIDRKKMADVFAKYTSAYNINDEKISLKVKHTYRVATLCDRIARSLKLPDYDIDLAWAVGLLHDVGRFEQIRNFGTFSDADSIDHAHYAVNILFDNGKLTDYLGDKNPYVYSYIENGSNNTKGGYENFNIIKKAIWNHSAYRIEEGLDERTVLFCNIIRDADKLDIFKVVNDTPLESMYNIDKNEIPYSEISSEVMQALREKHAVLRSLKKTPADYMAGYIALVFELVFPESFCIAKEQGYLENIMDFNTENKKTKTQIKEIKEIVKNHMAQYII